MLVFMLQKKNKCFFTVDCFLSNVTTSIDTPNVIAATNCSAKTYATPTYWRMSHQTLAKLQIQFQAEANAAAEHHKKKLPPADLFYEPAPK